MSYYTQRLAQLRAEAALRAAQQPQKYTSGEEHPKAKLTASQVALARTLRQEKQFGWEHIRQLINAPVSGNTIRKAVEGKTWKSV